MSEVVRFATAAPLLAENGYRPVPLVWGEKRPCISEWQRFTFAKGDEERHANAGTGILCGDVVAIDIDVRDASLAKQIEALATSSLGPAPVRVGQAPKRALLYTTDTPFRKLHTSGYRLPGDLPEDKSHRVEVLAEGSQIVAYGIHPATGAPYEWSGLGEPALLPVGLLPAITEAQARSFLQAAEQILAEGARPTSRLVAQRESRSHRTNEQLRAREPEVLREALAHITNSDVSYDDWIVICYAIKGALGETGRSDWLTWSAASAKDDIAATMRAWEAAQPTRIGAGTILHLARQMGWRRPSARTTQAPASSSMSPTAYAETDPTDAVTVEHFYAYLPSHQYIFVPSRELWPAVSVNARLGFVQDADGAQMKASDYLDRERAVEQMLWTPANDVIVEDRFIDNGGWVDHPGARCFNQYRPPSLPDGDAELARPWVAHVERVYGEDSKHVIRWLAQRVQYPAIKINHALVLGGNQGVGKDTILEPVKHAIGAWNFYEVSPQNLLGRFNSFVKSVILRVSEARDLGDVDRYGFYEHMKTYTATPPDVLRCDEKNVREYSVLNCCGVIITSNHKADGIYLPADDRRHYVAWSDLDRNEFDDGYWRRLWGWYVEGGIQHVGAYLAALDLSGFDPKAPPVKTAAFWEIVDAGRAPESAELADVLEGLNSPDALTLEDLMNHARYGQQELADWLGDRKSRRIIPHRLESAGYVPVRNDAANDGMWRVAGRRQAVYAKRSLNLRDRIQAASARAGQPRN